MNNYYVKTNKKGITPIIAIVLLLMMTVGAFGLTAVWVTETQKQMQNETTQQFLDTARSTASSISIVSVYNSSNEIKIVVKNSGRYPFDPTTALTAYVGGVYVDMSWSETELNPGRTTIGTVLLTDKKWSDLATATSVVTIRIEPPVGTPAVTTCKPEMAKQGSCGG